MYRYKSGENYKFTKHRVYVMYLTPAFIFGHSKILWGSSVEYVQVGLSPILHILES